jgi:hypothetical protein
MHKENEHFKPQINADFHLILQPFLAGPKLQSDGWSLRPSEWALALELMPVSGND